MKTLNITKLSVALMLFVGVASASVLAPVITPDGVALDPSSPGLGVRVMAIPGSVWNVWFNDDPAVTPGNCGDCDYNDTRATITFLVDLGMQVLFGNAVDSNVMGIGGISGTPGGIWLAAGQSGTFAVPVDGRVVDVLDWDQTTGNVYVSGPSSMNADGTIHAWVEQAGATAPEPATFLLIGAGLGLIGLVRRKRA